MQDPTDPHIDRIIRHLAGEMSPEETAQLHRWKSEQPDHQSLYDEIEALWNASADSLPSVDFDSRQDWEVIRPRLANDRVMQEPAPVVRKLSWRSWAVAATLALLVGLGIALLPSSGWFGPPTETLVTRSDQQEQSLPDGSLVTLNAGSQLKYPVVFSENERRVRLEGEAFFEIAPQKERFFVETATLLIEVRGTSFNVSAYAGDQPASISVSSGQVQVKAAHSPAASTLISTGQKALLSSGASSLQIVQAQVNDFSWKTGVLVFADTPLEEVVSDIGRHYRVKLSLEAPAMASRRYTGRFAQAELATVLETLGLSMGLTVSGNERDGYLLSTEK